MRSVTLGRGPPLRSVRGRPCRTASGSCGGAAARFKTWQDREANCHAIGRVTRSGVQAHKRLLEGDAGATRKVVLCMDVGSAHEQQDFPFQDPRNGAGNQSFSSCEAVRIGVQTPSKPTTKAR